MKRQGHAYVMATLIVATLILARATDAFAGPVRPIGSAQFNQVAPASVGPPQDPQAQQGQWFINVTNGFLSAGTWEFHDSDDSISISGAVVSILWGTGVPVVGYTNIAGFTILATVSNNISPMAVVSGIATNSHYEGQLAPQPQCSGVMKRARIAAEFAVAEAGPGGPPFVGIAPKVPGIAPPYYLDPCSAGQYVIEAQNEPLAAWYCFQNPLPQNPNNPPGAYYVPAWELGDIPPGGTAQVLMSFLIKSYGGAPAEMPYTDLRHGVIRYSYLNSGDVLYNRSESLKISHWLDFLLVDDGGLIHSVPYPEQEPVELQSASDVSVFFSTAVPGDRTALSITPMYNNQALTGYLLSWTALDTGPFVLQYCDNLVSNNWAAVLVNPPVPPMIPGPMSWVDDGTLILPPLQSPRFYRLVLP